MQEYQIVMLLSRGSDKLKERDWSGFPSFLLPVEALKLILHQPRIASPFPETTMSARCICRWTAWRPKTLPFIIVLEHHSDTGSHRAVHKPLQMSLFQSLTEGAIKPLNTSGFLKTGPQFWIFHAFHYILLLSQLVLCRNKEWSWHTIRLSCYASVKPITLNNSKIILIFLDP